jgi:hypothetical protein
MKNVHNNGGLRNQAWFNKLEAILFPRQHWIQKHKYMGPNYTVLNKRRTQVSHEDIVHEMARQNLHNSALMINSVSGSITPGSGYDYKCQAWSDLGSNLMSIMTADDNLVTRISQYKYDLFFASTTNIKVYPILVLAESGASFSTQEGSSGAGININSIIEAGISTHECKIQKLGEIISRPISALGDSEDHIGECSVDLYSVCKEYLANAEAAVFSQDVVPELKLLMFGLTTTANTPISYSGFRSYHSYSIDR